MICLFCHEKIIVQTNWSTVFYPNKFTKLCEKCETNLRLLKGNRCMKCSREHEDEICLDCDRWQLFYRKEGDPLIKNVSLYTYNAFMKEIVAKWKYRGDYILGTIFKNELKAAFHKHFHKIAKDAAIVPIPLSEERLYERGFNQAEMLASFLTDEIVDILERIHSEKQSKKTRSERMRSENPFTLRKPINKRVILVDDIYTTGRTVRHAAQLLRNSGCKEVYSFTLIRG